MKILCLYNNDCALELFDWIERQGNQVVLWKDRLEAGWCRQQDFALTVSYTYRYILTGEELAALKNNAVNIHNSFLPWNRGADPNLWSILDRTPRGVTLHYMEESLDKGEIIAQQLVNDGDEETLESSYRNLDRAAKQMFRDVFRYYPLWQSMRKIPKGKGSYHSVADGECVKALIKTYAITAREFLNKYEEMKTSREISGGGYKRNGRYAYADRCFWQQEQECAA